jgi:putative heme-binding domain-containing protein
MSAGRFKGELGQLMDAIGKDARFVLLSPIRHEDLRAIRPGLPDPAEHNKLLEQYSKVIEELAKERGVRFVMLWWDGKPPTFPGSDDEKVSLVGATENGIHLTEDAYVGWSWNVNDQLGWRPKGKDDLPPSYRPPFHAAILRKNALWFHRTRPANETYLFGFRKHEQGQNAKEIPEFDSLIEQADAEIDRLKRDKDPEPAKQVVAEAPKVEPLPVPSFDLGENLEISLWAETPLLVKPTQMNWDALGRLWVCGTAQYPMIAPGEVEKDQVFILEDTDHDGKADKSTVFAGGMLLPTAIVPDLKPGLPDSKNPGMPRSACYVGASTEILRFEDPDGYGKADRKHIVFSGFGTEDTHHNVHTLKWGPDGRLYFDQSVYTHTHLETPWGMVRVNSGGVFAYDPRTERVEVFCKGLWNPWGHVIDRNGQHFFTDGAGRDGIAWAFPGAVFAPNEGARQTMPLISPGTYPKFAGLEQIHSPHFPDDWQDTVVTCDFRAHRIVRFKINDLGPAKSGFVTSELPDIARTADLTFRPIDVKLGPDGALYIADWTNPVINHGEVDFRDPRRDHTHGRIWRVTYKGRPTVKLAVGERAPTLAGIEAFAALDKAFAERRSENAAARATAIPKVIQLVGSLNAEKKTMLGELPQTAEAERKKIAELHKTDPAAAAAEKKEFDAIVAEIEKLKGVDLLAALEGELAQASADDVPRVRIEAMRGLARFPSAKNTDLILTAAVNAPADDAYYAFAAWRSVNDVADVWVDAVLKGEWKPEGKEKQFEFALKAIEPGLAGKVLAQLVSTGKAPLDGSGPWVELIGLAGGAKELRALADAFAAGKVPPEAQARALSAFVDAARNRNVRPEGDMNFLLSWFQSTAANDPARRAAGLRAIGVWKAQWGIEFVAPAARAAKNPPEVRAAAFEALKSYGDANAVRYLTEMIGTDFPIETRRPALVTLAALRPNEAMKALPGVIAAVSDSLPLWRELFAAGGFAGRFAQEPAKDLPQPAYAAALRAAREQGKKGEKLVAALTPLAGANAAPPPPADYSDLVTQTLASGDPAAGELVYRRAGLACSVCHAIGGAGGKVGPELGTIGASAPLDYIIESLLNPNAKVKEGYNAVSLTQNDGNVSIGVIVRESANDIVIRTATGQEQKIAKDIIKTKDNLGSIMPAGLTEQLQSREKLNLYAFLSQLGKKGVYDASQGHIARVWWVTDKADGASGKAEGTPVFANVDGRLPRERMAESLAIFPNASAVFATAKITAAAPTKTQLVLAGVREAWLDGKPLAVASEPSPAVELSPGEHVLAVKLDPKSLPEILRAEAANTRFLTE